MGLQSIIYRASWWQLINIVNRLNVLKYLSSLSSLTLSGRKHLPILSANNRVAIYSSVGLIFLARFGGENSIAAELRFDARSLWIIRSASLRSAISSCSGWRCRRCLRMLVLLQCATHLKPTSRRYTMFAFSNKQVRSQKAASTGLRSGLGMNLLKFWKSFRLGWQF